jgi:hypothetical protein
MVRLVSSHGPPWYGPPCFTVRPVLQALQSIERLTVASFGLLHRHEYRTWEDVQSFVFMLCIYRVITHLIVLRNSVKLFRIINKELWSYNNLCYVQYENIQYAKRVRSWVTPLRFFRDSFSVSHLTRGVLVRNPGNPCRYQCYTRSM